MRFISYMNRPHTFFFLLLLSGICLLAWLIQRELIFNYDVSWLLEASKRLSAGGTYAHDFFENNPPLILYLYMPPLALSHLFSLNLILSMQIYICLLSLLSLYLCSFFTRKIFLEKPALNFLFLITLAFIYLVLPLFDFAQREHLLILFCMPYLLMITYRLEGNSMQRYHAAAIGLLGGIGFAIKPYFLTVFFLLELYYVLYQKNSLAWIRVETGVITALLMCYLAVIFFFHSDYLFIVMPFSLRWCYLGVSLPWPIVLFHPPVLFCLCVILFYAAQPRPHPYPLLCSALVIAIIGFLFSYAVQRTIFSYHLFPAYALAFLLLAMSFGLQARQILPDKYWRIRQALFIVIMSLFLYYNAPNVWTILVFQPAAFFIFFTGLFFISLYLNPLDQRPFKVLKIIFSVSIIITTGFLFSHWLQGTAWYGNRFLITVILLIGLFALLSPGTAATKVNYLILATSATLFFSFPAYLAYTYYNKNVAYKTTLRKLTDFVTSHAANRPVFIFSTWIYPFSQVWDSAQHGSRFSAFWMIGGLVKQSYLPMKEDRRLQLQKDKRFLIDMIAEDLNRYKPVYVLIETTKNKTHLAFFEKSGGTHLPTYLPFEYLPYFLKNPNFQEAWQAYHYVTTLKEDANSEQPIYQFAVFERKSRSSFTFTGSINKMPITKKVSTVAMPTR
ncbi:hypothetical protein [Aquicella lusitana]|uniref:4-amino-4-deoxy-L-arabinose transferase-like glycosyltransferase n=1 Tax=Aquicella lusitana TaxID=254246 RepID=A0A370GS31_9COXI|nr:hypothetical protein [Aquicella lusitana]RDI46497.1 4-amino-4-deoxy-L-arabinose transferase-like glycosyltransferase [Aquicella lusitana]VVC74161.1 hypothetical protein AQULUS_19260 [Aquicella lusitana]